MLDNTPDEFELSERDNRLALVLAELTDATLRGEAVDLEAACGAHPAQRARVRIRATGQR